jgi:glycosyltransferase involved in cell wall biosynthesis
MHVALSGWFWDRPDTGSGQYVRQLLTRMIALSPDIKFSLLAPFDPVQGQAAPSDVDWVSLPAPSGAWGKVWWEQVALPRAVRQLEADLLHVPYWAPPLFPTVPVVATVHDLIPLLLPAYRGGVAVRLYTALVGRASRRATLLLTDSQASRADIIRYLRVSPARVRAVPLAVEARYTPLPLSSDERLLRELGVRPGYLLYLGGFDIRKNLAVVFDVFALVLREMPAARLVVAGRLPQRDTAFAPDPRRLMRAAGLTDNHVTFTGFVPERHKPALYRAARGFFYPSRYEGFGLPPLEALACGVPVVGSDAASLPEIIGDGGVLADPDDVAALAQALIQLLSDDAYHTEVSRRALRQAAKFSWDTTVEATLAAYKELI